MNQTEITRTFGGNTVCASVGGGATLEQWAEYHTGTTGAGGPLVAYKRGPNHPVDPQKTVGSWSVVGTGNNAVVRYNYGAGGTYDYSVCSTGTTGTHDLCGQRNVRVTVRTGQVSCGFN
jgi:hypothetical protein